MFRIVLGGSIVQDRRNKILEGTRTLQQTSFLTSAYYRFNLASETVEGGMQSVTKPKENLKDAIDVTEISSFERLTESHNSLNE